MSDFFDDAVDESFKSKKKKTKLDTIKINNVLFKTSDNTNVTILVDEFLTNKQCEMLYKNVIKRIAIDAKVAVPELQILYGFKNKIDKERDIKNNKGNFYYDNKINFADYIPANSKVLTLGDAIWFGSDGNTDIKVECFLDFILDDTSFYSPQLKSQIFPIYDYFEFMGKDCFENFFSKHNIKKFLEYKALPKRIAKINKVVLNTKEEFIKVLEDNWNVTEICYDTETTSLMYYDGEIICFTFSFDDITGYYVDWHNVNKEVLSKFLKGKFQIGANLRFDLCFLRHNGITNCKVDFDTLHAGHMIYEMRSNSLKSHAYYYTSLGGYEQELDNYKRKYKIKSYKFIPRNILIPYAILDPIATYKTYKAQIKRLQDMDNKVSKQDGKVHKDWGLIKCYNEEIIPAVNNFVDVSLTGVCVDWDIYDIREKEVLKEIAILQNDIRKELNLDFDISLDFDEDSVETENNFFDSGVTKVNVNSNDVLGKLLEAKGLKDYGRNAKGLYNVNEDTLSKWVKDDEPIAKKIKSLHEYQTLHKTFIKGIKKFRNTHDKRIHANWGVGLAESWRTKSNNINLQNLPSRGWKSELVKSFYSTPNEDYFFYSYDSSGIQLRLFGMVNEDPVYRDVFINQGGDLHSKTATTVIMNNKVSFEEFLKRKSEPEYKQARLKAKNFNFALIFLGSAYTIKTVVIDKEWSFKEQVDFCKENKLEIIIDKQGNLDYALTVATEARKRFFSTYSQAEIYLLKEVALAKQRGYSQSFYGGIRRTPYLLYTEGKDENRSRLSNFESISVNSYIQNLESIIMIRNLNKLVFWLKENNMKTKLFGFIHDAGELYVHKSEVKQVTDKLNELFHEYFEEYNKIELAGEGNIADFHKGHMVVVKCKEDRKTILETYHEDSTLWDMGFDPEYFIDCINNGVLPERIIYK